MKILPQIFENNRKWADGIRDTYPDFFEKLSDQQNPEYLWIGCSDSRVPANEIMGLMPGEVFVHRNVANLVVHSDFNCLSVMQYAVEFLKVKHIIVCGHYGCGGVKASLDPAPHGLVDNWLRHIRDTYTRHQAALVDLPDSDARVRRLCELHIVEQVINVGNTTIVQDAWSRNQEITVHGWIYDVADGLLKDMDVTIRSSAELDALQGGR